MNSTLLKKRFFYYVVFVLLAQVISISKATAQGTTPFSTTWKAEGGSITILTSSSSGLYNYTVKYRKKGVIPFTTLSGRTSNCLISGLIPNDTIQVEITGTFPHLFMGSNISESPKLLTIEAWGNQNWKSMNNAFSGCSNLTYNAVDKPDLSSVTNMAAMFFNCSKFDGNISGWITDNVTDMSNMFRGANAFNQNIGSWNTANVTSMSTMFQNAVKFNQPLTNWNTAKVTTMFAMFSGANAFNQDLSVLNLGAVDNTGLTNMLDNTRLSVANYDATLTGWLSQNRFGLTLGASRLIYCAAEADRTTLTTSIANGGKGWIITDGGKACPSTTPFITTWQVANGNIIIPTNSAFIYQYTVSYKKKGTPTYTTLNDQRGNCTISGLTNGDIIQVEITGVFPHFYMNGGADAPKLLSIDAWGNQNWKNMDGAFRGCSNLTYTATDMPDLNSVTNMSNMFNSCSIFDGSIGGWNTSNITNMNRMFAAARKFNQPLTNWNTAKVTDMRSMFASASAFDQDLSVFKLDGAISNTIQNMLDNSGLSVANYDATLTGWLSQNKTGLTLGAAGLNYCASEANRTTLITPTASNGKGWNITGDTKQCATTPFITAWQVSGGNIIIPTNSASGTYYYTVRYKIKGTTDNYTIIRNQSGNCTISGLTNGDIIQVEITGVFPHFYMNDNFTEKTKLLSIDAWGNQVWKSMRSTFNGCSNLTYSAIDNPDLSSVTDMYAMFTFCSKFNGNVGGWNTGNVTDMSNLFYAAGAFNQNIGLWNTANVVNMNAIFYDAIKFNQSLTNWNTEKVTNMSFMFIGAASFNQPIGMWNTGAVVNMNSMFESATSFNQPIGVWNTGKAVSMVGMFKNAIAFNQNIGNWNVAGVNSMTSMFENATAFNQNLGKWDMRGVSSSNEGNAPNMLKNIGMNCTNYSATLYGWANSATPAVGVYLGDVSTNGINRQYSTNAVSARTILTNTVANGGKDWIITGDVVAENICGFGPSAPTASAQSHCTGKTVVDLVIISGQNIKWYAAAKGGTALVATTTLTMGTFYATQTVDGLESDRTAVSVTVNALPTATASSNSPICAGNTINLLGGTQGLFSYAWTGVNSFSSTMQNPSVPSATTLASGTYRVTVTNINGCTASAVTSVTVNSIPVTPTTVSEVTIYKVNSTTLVATGCTGEGSAVKWYETNTNNSVTMPVSPSVTTKYYAKCEQSLNGITCISGKSNDVTVSIVNRIFVDISKASSSTQNGTSWATAYGNLQTGLAQAMQGTQNEATEVWAAKGTYKPTATTNRDLSFVIPSGVRVYGGFLGTEDDLNTRDFRTNITLLSGEIGNLQVRDDNSNHVVSFEGSSVNTFFDGFTVTDGYANFYVEKSANLSIINPPLTTTVERGGGIILKSGANPLIVNCTFMNNAATTGGAIYANQSAPHIVNCKFMGNQGTFGSAIYLENNSSAEIENSLFSGNRGIGALYNNYSNPILTNCTFGGNGGYNGGIFNSNSQPNVTNSIFWGNTDPFNDTQSIIAYSIVQGGYLGVGNLNYDPQFVSPTVEGFSPNITGDYHLKSISLGIDRGNNGSISLMDLDLDGNLRRFNGGRVDMGAFEFQGNSVSSIVISVVSGNWEANSTWDVGRVPKIGDLVIVDNNHTVNLSGLGVAKNIEYRGRGTLKFNSTNSKLNLGF